VNANVSKIDHKNLTKLLAVMLIENFKKISTKYTSNAALKCLLKKKNGEIV